MAKSLKTVSNGNIDEYINRFPESTQRMLKQVRSTIKKEAPAAEEKISYGIPTITLDNAYLVYFAGWKNHISLYPISTAMETAITGLSAYYTSGRGTVQFPLDKPVPAALITKIVKFRMKEVAEKSMAKTKKK